MTLSERLCWFAWRVFEGGFWTGILGFFALMYVWYNEDPGERFMRRHIETPTVVAGQYLIIKSRLYRSKICERWIERRMYDGIGQTINFEPDRQERTFIGTEDRTVTIPVPITAAPGSAVYRPRTCSACNPLQKFFPNCNDLEELKFSVLPAPGVPYGTTIPLQQPSVESIPQ